MVVTLPRSAKIWGTVAGTDGASVRLAGLERLARLGDRIEIETPDQPISGEIIAIDGDDIRALLMSPPKGLATGWKAWLIHEDDFAPSNTWLGHVIDAFGTRLDGGPIDPGHGSVPTDDCVDRPSGMRRPLGPRLTTGVAALDTFLPLRQGQRIGIFAGSGVGKSRLMADLALGVAADVVVIGLIGERSREVGDFVRLLTDANGMARTIIITATSDQPALHKRRAARLALATAEHFRDQGKHV
ncbi:MAG: flagellum-specific ATP synthase FliI, partial [Pseudomonadota bacterium]